jgi:ABC-type transport system substrate-binding protein
MDALIERLETEMNAQRRKDIVRQMLTKIAQEVPEVYIGFAPYFFTFRDYVKAFPNDSHGRWMTYQSGLNYTWLDK